jgi:hypothetical protein
MSELNILQRRATAMAARQGHTLRWQTILWNAGRRTIRIGTCRHCCMQATADADPGIREKSIDGEAITTPCSKRSTR